MTPPVLAHLGAPTILLSAAVQSLWFAWNFSPSLVLGILLLTGAYLYAIGPLRKRVDWAGAVEQRQIVYFVAGVVVLVIALMSPIDEAGDTYLFGVHMIQHMLLAVIVPPLLLLGIPDWLGHPIATRPLLRRAARWIAHPVVAFGVFNADLWLWHAPALYDLTLANENVHVLEHLTFVVLGMWFWLPILGPRTAFPRVADAVGVVYLFLGCQPMVVLGALLTFAANPFYLPYVSAPRMWGLSPLQDQQLGGLIMWLPTNIPYLIALSLLFFRWVGAQDKRELAAAGQLEYPEDEPYELFPTAARAETDAAPDTSFM